MQLPEDALQLRKAIHVVNAFAATRLPAIVASSVGKLLPTLACGKAISRQLYNILDKIRTVDALRDKQEAAA